MLVLFYIVDWFACVAVGCLVDVRVCGGFVVVCLLRCLRVYSLFVYGLGVECSRMKVVCLVELVGGCLLACVLIDVVLNC